MTAGDDLLHATKPSINDYPNIQYYTSAALTLEIVDIEL